MLIDNFTCIIVLMFSFERIFYDSQTHNKQPFALI